jgi:hypothetical protein
VCLCMHAYSTHILSKCTCINYWVNRLKWVERCTDSYVYWWAEWKYMLCVAPTQVCKSFS